MLLYLSMSLLFSVVISDNNTNIFCANKNSCLKLPTSNSRLVDGEVAQRHSRPFQVALYSRVGVNGALGFCGGVLVDQQWVLTAAHCCYHHGELVDHVQAVLGAHSLYDRYENGRRVLAVTEVVVHPEWDQETLHGDLALLRLANGVQLSDAISLVRLPYLNTSTFNFAGQAATVSGWGIPANGVTFISPTLRQKVMIVLNDDTCNSRYNNQLPEGIICSTHDTAGTCKGDNGGPLTVYHSRTEETLLVGVASFVNVDGCNFNIPSVFTRVSNYLDWISRTANIQLL